jgi:tetratricopeptide (TPR) repeat protein
MAMPNKSLLIHSLLFLVIIINASRALADDAFGARINGQIRSLNDENRIKKALFYLHHDLLEPATRFANSVNSYWEGPYVLGMVSMAEGRNEEAVKDFTNSIYLDPTQAVTYRARASAYSMLKEWDKSIRDLRKSLVLQNDATAWQDMGFVLRMKSDFSASKAALQKAIRMNPQLVAAQYNMAATSYELAKQINENKDWSMASISIRKAIALAPIEHRHTMNGLRVSIESGLEANIKNSQNAAKNKSCDGKSANGTCDDNCKVCGHNCTATGCKKRACEKQKPSPNDDCPFKKSRRDCPFKKR